MATAGPESQEVYLQPVASAGPDPFTTSSATAESAPVQPPLPNATGRGIRTVNAATPGLYGGTQRLGSCDVEQQVRYLTTDEAKSRAFAEAAGIEAEKIPGFLRDLTPVVLRADTRVTNHGFRDGRADSFQAVLQAGTAVLVDGHGMPRVRCGCGNPLQSPRAAKGSPVHKGDPWNGYQANQVVVIEPTTHVIENLVIVNIADNTWIERKRGDDGARDRAPQVVPPYDPADGIPNGPVTPSENTTGDPCATTDDNSLARTAPPTPPAGRSDGIPGAPAAGPADCPPTPPGSQTSPSLPNSPASPGGTPPRSPGLPPNPATPQQPPSDVPGDVPGDAPADIPSDLPPYPSDPGTVPDPDGPVPDQSGQYDPFADPYADPYTDPDLLPPTSPDESPLLESA
uniref:DUF6777 domain-containing protein n=1 Tax=Streptomyces sp. NBC_00049 TaxID=2903617 RepID=A0AAU2JX23_9ACTN